MKTISNLFWPLLTLLLIIISATMAWDGLSDIWGWFYVMAMFSGIATILVRLND